MVSGTVVGAILNCKLDTDPVVRCTSLRETPLDVMMLSIINNQRDALLSISGTRLWSGQNAQQYNCRLQDRFSVSQFSSYK